MPVSRFEKKYFIIMSVILILLIAYSSIQPSNDRNWNKDQLRLSSADLNGNSITLHNIRNNTYRSTTDYDVKYYDRTINLTDIETVWFIIEPFNDEWEGLAHTFLSFGLKDDTFIAVSVEIRKEQGETYSPWKGMAKNYEIMYVLADEQDAVKLRSNFRKDEVFVYPINTTPPTAQLLFMDILQKINKLTKQPEFYNTFTNTCTTTIAEHVNNINPGVIPFSTKIMFPGYADRLAYDLGMIDTNLTFEEARKQFNINQRAMQYANDPNWSIKIREVN